MRVEIKFIYYNYTNKQTITTMTPTEKEKVTAEIKEMYTAIKLELKEIKELIKTIK